MEKDKVIDIRRYVAALSKHRWLYVAAAVVLLAMATFYAVYRMDQYEVSGSILIESENSSSGAGSAMLGGELTSLMRSFSLGSSLSKSVDNEAEIIASPRLTYNAVVRQHYNHVCTEYDGILRSLMHRDCPVTIVTEPEYEDTLRKPLKFMIKLSAAGDAEIEVKKGLLGRVVGSYSGKLPAKIKTIYGTFVVMGTDAREPRDYDLKYIVANRWDITADLVEKISIAPGKKSDIVSVTMPCANRERGIDFVNALFEEYLSVRRVRKDKVTSDELQVINDRLAAIASDLSSSEASIEQFKNKHNITDLTSEVVYLFRENKEADAKVVGYRSEQAMLQMALATLRDKDKYAMLPIMNMGENATNSVVAQYNDLIVRRMNLLQSAKEDNAMLQMVTENIDAMRSVVIESIEKANENLDLLIRSILSKSSQNSSRLNTLPAYEREYLDLMRNQMFTNQLYLFLLQKRENNMLKIASTDEAGNIFQPAYAELKPSPTKTIIAFAAALIMAVLLPTVYVLWRLWRRDLLLGDYDFADYDNVACATHDTDALRHVVRADDRLKRLFVVSLTSDDSLSAKCATLLHEALTEVGDEPLLCLLSDDAARAASRLGEVDKVTRISQLPDAAAQSSIISLAATGLSEAAIVEHGAVASVLGNGRTAIVPLASTATIGLVPAGSQVIVVARLNEDRRSQLRKAVDAVAPGNRCVVCYV